MFLTRLDAIRVSEQRVEYCAHFIEIDVIFLVGAFSLKEINPTITMGSFLVGAFSLKEKSPTLTVGNFLKNFFS